MMSVLLYLICAVTADFPDISDCMCSFIVLNYKFLIISLIIKDWFLVEIIIHTYSFFSLLMFRAVFFSLCSFIFCLFVKSSLTLLIVLHFLNSDSSNSVFSHVSKVAAVTGVLALQQDNKLIFIWFEDIK